MSDLYALLDSAGEYIPNFSFMLRVDGMFDVPLKTVRAFTRENEYDYIQEGGQNDYVYIKRKPVSKPFTIICERYIPTQLNDPLSNGTELTLPLMLFIGKNVGGKFDAGNAGRYYVFTGAVVMSKEYGQLDAEHSGLLTETVTIGYNRMFCVTNPVDESSKPAWQMNEDLDPDSTGNRKQLYSKSSRTPLGNQATKTMHKANAVLWEFDEDNKEGSNVISANHLKEDSKAAHTRRRHEYDFAAENNPNYQGENKSMRSAQNAKYSEAERGAGYGIKELSEADMAALAREFQFTTDGSIVGNEQLSSRRHGENLETRRKDMEELGSEWGFDGTAKGGTGNRHIVRTWDEEDKDTLAERASVRGFGGIDEPVKDSFTGEARKWEFSGKDKDGGGTRSRQNAIPAESEGGDISGLGVTEHSRSEMESVAHRWEFKDQFTKAGAGASSRASAPVPELSKDDMAARSQQHVKVTIEDFLMDSGSLTEE